MAAAIARHRGARHIVITDINRYRLGLATYMGATLAVDVSQTSLEKALEPLNLKDGFTVGMEMSGSPDALESLLKHMQRGGQVALLGIFSKPCYIDWNQMIFNLLTIKGIYGRKVFSTWYKMSHMLESGLNISPIITHEFPLDDFQEAFDLVKSGNCGKVNLTLLP